MLGKIVSFVIAIVFVILLFLLPVWPLMVEVREFTQTGESLYQEWRFVSMGEFYDYAHYARTAWLESTKLVYVLLSFVNPLVLISVSWMR